MAITTQLNEKANVKRGSAADTLIAGRRVVSLEETQVSTASQTTIIIGTFAVDVTQSKNLLVIIDGKVLTEGASNDYTLTSVSPSNTSNTISLSQSLSAGLNIKLLYLGVVVTNSTSLDTLSPAMSDPKPYTPTFGGTLGGPTNVNVFYNQEGKYIYVTGSFVTGTPIASLFVIDFPSGISLDAKVCDPVAQIVGMVSGDNVATSNGDFNGGFLFIQPGVSVTQVYLSNIADSGTTKNLIAENANYSFNPSSRYSFWFKLPVSTWSSNVIAQNSKVFKTADYAANGTNVTTNPASLGEYRTYQKNASALTGSDNAAAAPFLPTNADGFRIDGSVAYASAGTSGRPNRIEAFVGFDKHVTIQMYSSAGRTGAVDVEVNPDTATTYYGVSFGYDPTTGIAFADAIDQPTSTTSRFAGRSIPTGGGAPADAAYIYFDWIVSDNVLPVQYSDPSKVARNEIKVYGRNGSGTGTPNSGGAGGPNIPRFATVQFNYGTAITYVDDVTYGGSFVINEPGVYSMWYSDDMTGGAQGITLNAYQLSTNINAVDAATVLSACNATNLVVSGTAFLQVGDVIRGHTNGGAPGSDTSYEHFHIVKIANG